MGKGKEAVKDGHRNVDLNLIIFVFSCQLFIVYLFPHFQTETGILCKLNIRAFTVQIIAFLYHQIITFSNVSLQSSRRGQFEMIHDDCA